MSPDMAPGAQLNSPLPLPVMGLDQAPPAPALVPAPALTPDRNFHPPIPPRPNCFPAPGNFFAHF